MKLKWSKMMQDGSYMFLDIPKQRAMPSITPLYHIFNVSKEQKLKMQTMQTEHNGHS